MSQKHPFVLGIGFQKTGTSTLRDALKILGYKVKDTSLRPIKHLLKGEPEKAIAMLNGFDAAEDTPWYKLYKEIDAAKPGTKFILTYREPESWYKSVARHIGDLRSPKHEWLYGRGNGLPKDNKENTLKVYNEHIAEVRAYFKDRPEDFLEIDFTKGAGFEDICNFLGHSVPKEGLPHANKTDYSKAPNNKGLKKWFKNKRKRIKYGLIIQFFDLLGYWK